MSVKLMQQVVAAIRHVDSDVPSDVAREKSLVLELGFDSMKMTLLSLALETELGCAIVLDGWIAAHADPNDLTVGSLCDYLEATLGIHEDAAAAE